MSILFFNAGLPRVPAVAAAVTVPFFFVVDDDKETTTRGD